MKKVTNKDEKSKNDMKTAAARVLQRLNRRQKNKKSKGKTKIETKANVNGKWEKRN